MTAPWAEARVEAELDWGNIDEELQQRLTRSVAVATRKCQRHFDELERNATKNARSISRNFDREFDEIVRHAGTTATKVNRELGRIDETVDIELRLDSGDVAGELRRTHRRLQTQASVNPIELDVNVDTDRPTRALRRLSGSMSSVGSGVKGLTRGLFQTVGTLGKFAAIAGVAAVSLGSLVPIVGALGVGLAAVGGAAAGGAVAGLAAVGMAAGMLKTAFSGVGDAAALMFDPDKAAEFEEALAKLSPAARETMRSVQGLGKAYADVVKTPVQESFFSGLGPEIAKLSQFLPVLRDSLVTVADGFNEGAKSALGFINGAEGAKTVSLILERSGNMAGTLGSALGNLVPGLLAIGESATYVFEPLTGGLAESAKGFSDMLLEARNSGQMDTWFQNAISTAKQFGAVLGQVGSGIAGIFRAASAAGDGNPLAGILGSVTKVSEWINGPGQAALTSFFQSSTQAMGAIMPVFLQVAGVIGTTVAPIIADLAIKLGPVLGPAVAAIGQAISAAAPQISLFATGLAKVIEFLTPLLPLIGPLLPALLGIGAGIAVVAKVSGPLRMLAHGFQVVRSALFILTPAIRAFGMALVANPIGLIIAGVVALGVALWAFFTKTEAGRRLWDTIWNGIKTAVSVVWEWLKTTVFPPMQAAFRMIGDAVMWLWHNVMTPAWTAIQAVISVWWSVVQVYWAAFKAALSVVGAAVMWLWKSVIVPAFTAIKAVIGVWWAGVQIYWTAFKAALSAVGAVVMWLWNAVVVPAFNAIRTVIGVAVGIIGTILDTLAGFFQGVADKVTVVKDWIVERLEAVVTFITQLPGKIASAAAGMWDGIKDAFRSALNWIIDKWNTFKIPAMKVKGVQVTPEINFPDLPRLATGGRLDGFRRATGVVRGPGGPTDDLVPALLSNRESVNTAAATDRHWPLFEQLNRGVPLSTALRGLVPGFAAGGSVREAYGLPAGTSISAGGEGFPQWVYDLGKQFGVQPSTYAGHQEGSGQNKGIDWTGPTANLQRFAEFAMGTDAEQVIWSNPDTGEKLGLADGQKVGPGTSQPGYYRDDWGGHQDHVHTRQSYALRAAAGDSYGIETTGSTTTSSSTSGGTPIGSGIGSSGSGSGASWGNSGGGSAANSISEAKRSGLTPVWVENWPATMGGSGAVPSSADTGSAVLDPGASSTVPSSTGKVDTIPLKKNPDGTYSSTDPEWDKLIQRESGGRADIVQQIQDVNSGGNEASGLFQIARGTWKSNGGTKYAPSAGEATPEQQAEIAAKIFNDQGGSPWGSGAGQNFGREDEAKLRAGIQRAGSVPTTPQGNVPVEVTNPGTPELNTAGPDTAAVPTKQDAAADRPELSGSPSQIGGNAASFVAKDVFANSPELAVYADPAATVANAAVSGQLSAALGAFGLDFEPRALTAFNQYLSDNQQQGDQVTKKDLASLLQQILTSGFGAINVTINGDADGQTVAKEIDADRKRKMRRYVLT